MGRGGGEGRGLWGLGVKGVQGPSLWGLLRGTGPGGAGGAGRGL